MRSEVKKTLTITVEDNQIDNLKSAVNKAVRELEKPGFKNTGISIDEIAALKDLQNNIL